jgi:hypothetical protein
MVSQEIRIGLLGAMMMRRCLAALAFLLLGTMTFATKPFGSVAYAAGDSPKDVIAAQIRIQGFACNRPLRAVLDKRKSKPDHEVWILECDNATYRFSRYPDMAAKVDILQSRSR